MAPRWTLAEPMPDDRPLHPRHGTHEPTAGTPPRPPGSVRRTATIDALRPDGIEHDLVLVGRARDLVTDAGGRATVLDEASMRLRVAFMDERQVVAIETSPPLPGSGALVGVSASSGFRRVLDDVVPTERDRHTLLYLLLDDVPVATLVSGYAVGHAGVRPVRDARHHLQHPDLCAGWRVGGTILVEMQDSGHAPVVTGPPAPSLAVPDDPIAWHDVDPLPGDSMRRHRRLDLIRGETLTADVLFRDSHVSRGGVETIVHEYTVRATLDPRSLEVLHIEATPQVLPWEECPAAAASARRLAGTPVGDLRGRVRQDFTGPSTCTHLNDTLRSLEDIEALAPLLREL